MDKNNLYRKIPKVDLLLEKEEIQDLIGRYSRETVMRRSTQRQTSFGVISASARKNLRLLLGSRD